MINKNFVCPQSCGGQRRSSNGGTPTTPTTTTTPQHQSATAGCAHRRPSMPQTKRTCQQPTFVHQDELWLTQTQRHANRSPPPVTRGLLNNNVDSPTDDGKCIISRTSGSSPKILRFQFSRNAYRKYWSDGIHIIIKPDGLLWRQLSTIWGWGPARTRRIKFMAVLRFSRVRDYNNYKQLRNIVTTTD